MVAVLVQVVTCTMKENVSLNPILCVVCFVLCVLYCVLCVVWCVFCVLCSVVCGLCSVICGLWSDAEKCVCVCVCVCFVCVRACEIVAVLVQGSRGSIKEKVPLHIHMNR